jgi:hypothetical protein
MANFVSPPSQVFSVKRPAQAYPAIYEKGRGSVKVQKKSCEKNLPPPLFIFAKILRPAKPAQAVRKDWSFLQDKPTMKPDLNLSV